jgi:Putative rRNA methylase
MTTRSNHNTTCACSSDKVHSQAPLLAAPTACACCCCCCCWQEAAVAATRQRLQSQLGDSRLPDVTYACTCHSRMQEVAGSNVARLVCFNLGYLPKGDKALITQSSSTVAAIEAAFEVSWPTAATRCRALHAGLWCVDERKPAAGDAWWFTGTA